MREFKTYLKKPGCTSVEGSYTAEELTTKIIIQNAANHTHIVFDSLQEFVDYYQYDIETYCYYETITCLRPQRLKLDIDSKRTIDIEIIIEAAITAFRELWPRREDPEIIVCSAHGAGKFSYHIILDAFVEDNVQCQLFRARTAAYSGDCADVIDPSVDKRIQYFRIVGSTKPKENRPFISDRPAHLCLVSPPGNWPVLPSVVKPPPALEQQLPPEDSLVQKILNAYGDPHHTFRCVSRVPGAWYCILDFDRIAPDTAP